MGRGGNKKRNAEIRIAHLEIKKRNGILVAVAAFIGLAVVIALKLMLQNQFEWLNSTFGNMGLFIFAIVCAGIAGWGSRTWNRARKEIFTIQSRSKGKSKK